MPFINESLLENDSTAVEKELELIDSQKGEISFDLNSQSLDERLRPFREAKLHTMRYAMGKVWSENWYMHRVFSARAQQFPHSPAYLGFYEVQNPNEELTYRQLDNVTSLLSLEIANLMPPELPKMPTLVIYLNRGSPLICSVIATMKCHMAMVVVEDNAPITRLFFVLEDTSAFVLLTTKELHQNMMKSLKERESTNPGEDKIPDNLNVLYVDQKCKELEIKVKSSSKDYIVPTDIAKTNSPFGIPPLLEHTVMCIIYTSGSTGKPKGVMLEYGGFSNYAAIEQVVTAMRPGDRNLQTQSLSFVAGFHEIWRCLLSGGTLYFATSKAIAMLGPDLSAWMIKHKINIFKAVPSLLRTLIVKASSSQVEGEVIMPDLRVCHIGGEPITPELVEYFAAPHRNFLNTYGSTETSSNCSIGQCFPGQTVTIGSALPTFSSHILKDGKAADVGILFIGGKSLARGYLNLPEANKKFQIVEGLGRVFDTGDLTEYIEGTKNVKFCGRADRQIKINGYRLELDEVEIAVRRLPIVKEAVVVFKESVLIAFIQPMNVSELDGFKIDVIKPILLKNGLPYYGVPSQFRLLKEFPKTVTGKLDNTQLFSVPLLKSGKEEDGEVESLNEIENIVGRLFEDMLVLPRNSITRRGSFFELGGDSGKAGLAISKLRQSDSRFDSVSVSDLYANPTLAGLSKIIEDREKKNKGPTKDLFKDYSSSETPRPYLCASIQFFVGIVLMWLDALHLFIGYLYVYPYMNRLIGQIQRKGHVTIGLEDVILIYFPVMLTVWLMAYLLISFVLVFIFKWCLIGRYRPGRYKLYGSFFIRHWIVDRFSRRVHWSIFYYNPFLKYLLFILGARVGKRLYLKVPDHSPLSGFDLLDFGDDVSVNYAYVSPISYTADAIVCGKISFCHGTSILPRATVLGPIKTNENLKTVDVLTYFGTFAGGEVPNVDISKKATKGSWVSGAPAEIIPQPELNERYEMNYDGWFVNPLQGYASDKNPWLGFNLGPTLYAFVDFLFQVFESYIASCVIVIPQAILVRVIPNNSGLIVYLVHPAFFLLSFFVIGVLLPGLSCFLAVKCFPSKKGTYHLFSMASLIIKYKQKWFSSPQMMLNNSLFMNTWMKWCGVKLGDHVELSQIKGLPDMITLGSHSFFANFTHMAVPHAHQGRLCVGPAIIGSNCLVGNNACIPINSVLHDGCVLGVLSCPPQKEQDRAKSNQMWIGNPPIALPRGKEVPVPELNFRHYLKRVLDDILLTSTPTLWWILLLGSHLLLLYLCSQNDLMMTFNWVTLQTLSLQEQVSDWLIVPLIITCTRIFFGFIAAWTALRFWSPRNNVETNYRYKSNFIFKWRHYNKSWSMFIRPMLVAPFEGSIWMNIIYRITTKVKIGDWAFIASDTCFRDHNFVTIGDRCVISDEVVFRTHTFENWNLKFSRVIIDNDCCIRPSTTLMCGCHIGNNSIVCSNSLVMKNESIKQWTLAAGIPAKSIYSLPQSTKSERKRKPEEEVDEEKGDSLTTALLAHYEKKGV